MPNIPLVQQRVSPTTQVGAVPSNLKVGDEAARAMGLSMQRVGAYAEKIGKDMRERQNRLKYESDMADYDSMLVDFKAELSKKETEAMFDPDSPVPYDELYSTVIKPLLDQFKNNLSDRGYSDEALRDSQQKWQLDEALIKSGKAKQLDDRIRADRVDKVKKRMWNNMILDTEESRALADEDFEFLKRIEGEEKAGRMRQAGEYNREYNVISSLESVDAVQNYKVKSKNPSHKEALDTFKNNRINAIVSESKKKYLGTTRELNNLIKENEVSEQALNAYEAAGGKASEKIRRSIELATQNESPKEKRKAAGYVYDFLDEKNKLTLDKAIEKVMGLKLSLSTKSAYVQELLDGAETIGSKSTIYDVPIGLYGELGRKEVKTVSGYKTTDEKQSHKAWNDLTEELLAVVKGEDQFEAAVDLSMEVRGELLRVYERFPNIEDRPKREQAVNDLLKPMAEMTATEISAPQLWLSSKITLGRSFNTVEEAVSANLPKGTVVLIDGRRARID